MRTDPGVALTIGGSDSAGRCGVAADLATFAAFGLHGCLALTVVTAQDTVALRQAWPLPVGAVSAQVEAVLGDLPVAAVKTGMLGRVELIEELAQVLSRALWARPGPADVPLVVDPVLVDGTGAGLFGAEVVAAYRRHLFPRARLVTPNRDELQLLTGRRVESVGQLVDAAGALAEELDGPAVLATGGRLAGERSVDVLVSGDGSVERLSGPRIHTLNVAGTGDVLSAAVAAGLARGLELSRAVHAGRRFVADAIAGAAAWHLGAGRGPLDLAGAGARALIGRVPDADGDRPRD